MANFTDTFDETRNLVEVEFQNGKEIKANELNELQRIERVRRRRTVQALKLAANSFNGDGFKVVEDTSNINQFKLKAGNGFVGGEYISLENDFIVTGLTTPGAPRVDEVYLEVREIERTSVDFPDIGDTAIGETTTRLQLVVTVQIAEGGVTPASSGELHEGGVVRVKIATLNRDANNTVTAAEIVDERPLTGLTVAEGGTGTSSFDDGAVIVGGGGANPLEYVAPVSDGLILRDKGVGNNPEYDSLNDIIADTLNTDGANEVARFMDGPYTAYNYGLSATSAAEVLTIALKRPNNTDPTPSDPCRFTFSLTTTNFSYPVYKEVTSALSVSVPVGASLGHNPDGVTTRRIFAYLFYQGSTPYMAVSSRSDLDSGDTHNVEFINTSSDIITGIYAPISASQVVLRLLGTVYVVRTISGGWANPIQVATNTNNVQLDGAPGTLEVVGNQMTSTGANSIANLRTRTVATSVGTGGVALSNGSGIVSTTSNSSTSTGLNVSITSTGRPIFVGICSDLSSGGETNFGTVDNSGGSVVEAVLEFRRNGSAIEHFVMYANFSDTGYELKLPITPWLVDPVGAGAYTYELRMFRGANAGGSDVVTIRNYRIVAFEL